MNGVESVRVEEPPFTVVVQRKFIPHFEFKAGERWWEDGEDAEGLGVEEGAKSQLSELRRRRNEGGGCRYEFGAADGEGEGLEVGSGVLEAAHEFVDVRHRFLGKSVPTGMERLQTLLGCVRQQGEDVVRKRLAIRTTNMPPPRVQHRELRELKAELWRKRFDNLDVIEEELFEALDRELAGTEAAPGNGTHPRERDWQEQYQRCSVRPPAKDSPAP